MTTTTPSKGKGAKSRRGAKLPRKGRGRRGIGPAPEVDVGGDADATIAEVAGKVAAEREAGDDDRPAAVIGQVYELTTKLRGAVGKHGAKYKARLVAALRDEKDPLYEVLRKAGKRVLAKTIMGD